MPILIYASSRYYGSIFRVYTPRFSTDAQARDDFKADGPSDDDEPHVIGGDLGIPLPDAKQRDDPDLYYYWIEILEPEKEKGEKGKAAKALADQKNIIGSLMECQCGTLRYALHLDLTLLANIYLHLAGIV
jgi:hypothetical protein